MASSSLNPFSDPCQRYYGLLMRDGKTANKTQWGTRRACVIIGNRSGRQAGGKGFDTHCEIITSQFVVILVALFFDEFFLSRITCGGPQLSGIYVLGQRLSVFHYLFS